MVGFKSSRTTIEPPTASPVANGTLNKIGYNLILTAFSLNCQKSSYACDDARIAKNHCLIVALVPDNLFA